MRIGKANRKTNETNVTVELILDCVEVDDGNYVTYDGDDDHPNIFVYHEGDGNYLIRDFKEEDMLKIYGNTYSTQTRGNDVILKIGNGSITLQGAKDKAIKICVEDYFHNFNDNDKCTLYADCGDDTIYNRGETVSIISGASEVYNSVREDEENNGVIYYYNCGDYEDIIYGFKDTDTLKIGNGRTYATQTSGEDIIVKVGKGKITLKGAKNKKINIFGEGDETIQNFRQYSTIVGGSGDDKIYGRCSGVLIDAGDGIDSYYGARRPLLPESKISTGIGFFDHMLKLFAAHGQFDLKVSCKGDLEVDGHHSVEDIGIAMGAALKEALGDKHGITRYGTFFLPMDETLALVSLDISGRPFLVFEVGELAPMIGTFDTELVEEFLRAFAFNAGITLHVKILYGKNSHHKVEAIFKALGHALRTAVTVDEKIKGVPSTKGVL